MSCEYTDEEIKNILECCSKSNCDDCHSDWSYSAQWDCMRHIERLALDLINRQQTEIEVFRNRQKPTVASGFKIEDGKIVFFTDMLDGYRHEYESLDEVVKTLNELLQECYIKDELAFALKTAKVEAVKEFAEKLKEEQEFFENECGDFVGYVAIKRINNMVEGKVEDAE